MVRKEAGIVSVIFLLLFMLSLNLAEATGKKFSSVDSKEYIVPQREIMLTPYISYIFARDLYAGYIEDQSGFGIGITVQNQIYRNLGFVLDAMWTDLDIAESGSLLDAIDQEASNNKQVLFFSGGFYYEIINEWEIDLCYGAVTAGNNVMTIFIPSLAYIRPVSGRLYLFAKASYLLTNDWIADVKYEEHYTSFALRCGLSIKF